MTTDRTWDGPLAGGSFSTALNWTGNVVPDADDVATFDNPALFGTVNMPSTADMTNLRLRMRRGDMLFDLNGRSWNLTAPATANIPDMSLIVGDTVGTALVGGGGTLNAVTAAVSPRGDSNATFTVLSGTTVNLSDTLRICVLGGTGRVFVNGTFNSGGLLMSQGGVSSLTIGAGGSFESLSGVASIGRGGASAHVLVEGGGHLRLGHTNFGEGASGTGILRVTGTGSRARMFGTTNVGLAGVGSLLVQNGGYAQVTVDLNLGALAGSAGSLTIQDDNSHVVVNGDLYVGGSAAGQGGFGRATILPDTILDVTGVTQLYDNRIDLAGGLLRTGDLRDQPVGGVGSINWTSGALVILDANFQLNSFFGPLGNNLALGAGKTLRVPNNTIQNDGSLAISGGGEVQAHTLRMGSDPAFGGPGFTSVSGLGSLLDVTDSLLMSEPPVIGSASASTLNVSSGQVKVGNLLKLNPLARASVTGGSFTAGALTIRGGSFSHSGTSPLLVSRDLTSFTGAGLVVDSIPGTTVQIEAGGRLSTVSGRIGISNRPTAAGSVNLTGAGSQWTTGSVTFGNAAGSASGSLLVADGARFIAGGVGVLVNRTGTVCYNGGSFATTGLNVDGGRTSLSSGRDKVLRVAPGLSASFSITNGGIIDLADNAMIVGHSGASYLTTIRTSIASAYNGGAWDGPGLTSSGANASTHGLGYGEASEVFTAFPATFLGHVIDADNTLVRYTRYGDADLNGTVNLQDFNEVAAHFGMSGAVWTDGDFDYDGNVNLLDFNRLAANFGMAAGGDGAPGPDDWAALASAVPEPAVLAPVVGVVAGLRRKRRA